MLNAGAWDHIRILTSPRVRLSVRESSILEQIAASQGAATMLYIFNRFALLNIMPFYPCTSVMLPRGASRYLREYGSLAATRRGGSRNRQDSHGK